MGEHTLCMSVGTMNHDSFCMTLLVKHTFCVWCGSCMAPPNPKHIHISEPQYQFVVVVVGVVAMVPANLPGEEHHHHPSWYARIPLRSHGRRTATVEWQHTQWVVTSIVDWVAHGVVDCRHTCCVHPSTRFSRECGIHVTYKYKLPDTLRTWSIWLSSLLLWVHTTQNHKL